MSRGNGLDEPGQPRTRIGTQYRYGTETVASVARTIDAKPRGTGTWFAVDCPECGSSEAVAVTRWGWECRWDGCRRASQDLDTLVRRVRAAGTPDPPVPPERAELSGDKHGRVMLFPIGNKDRGV